MSCSNDNGDRSRVFQTRGCADAEALKLAIAASAKGLARHVRFIRGAYEPIEGGSAFEHFLLVEGWGVREIPAAEITRRVQSGMRGEIDRLLEEAERAAGRAKQLLGTKFSTRHRIEALEFRDRARELELALTIRRVS